MDLEKCDKRRIYSKSVGVRENSSDSVLQAVVVLDSKENVGVSGDTGGSVSMDVLIKEQGTISDHKVQNVQQDDARTIKDDGRCTSNSTDYVSEEVAENVTVMSPLESQQTRVVERRETNVKEKIKEEKKVKDSHVIELRSSSDNKEMCEGERVCRICHLSNDLSPDASGKSVNVDLIQIGCGCKDELGIAHAYCAEAWFKVKGNRICEICGQTATNITGAGNHGFMEEWNGRRFTNYGDSSFNQRRRCLRGQSLCNFLMACLVTAFVLPWFLHVDLF